MFSPSSVVNEQDSFPMRLSTGENPDEQWRSSTVGQFWCRPGNFSSLNI